MKQEWSEIEDDILLDLVGDMVPYPEIAQRLGRTKNSCIGRMWRLARKLDNKPRY